MLPTSTDHQQELSRHSLSLGHFAGFSFLFTCVRLCLNLRLVQLVALRPWTFFSSFLVFSVCGKSSSTHDFARYVLRNTCSIHNMPLRISYLRSSHNVFPVQEQTVLSLSQTPALRAITPTTVLSSLTNGPVVSSCFVRTMA